MARPASLRGLSRSPWMGSSWPRACSCSMPAGGTARGTTTGAVVPRCRNHRHHRCQPGARSRPRSHRCPGQRLARPGAGRLVRTLDDADQDGTPGECSPIPSHVHGPAHVGRGTGRITRMDGSTKPGADVPGTPPVTASARSPANSTSTAARSGASSRKNVSAGGGALPRRDVPPLRHDTLLRPPYVMNTASRHQSACACSGENPEPERPLLRHPARCSGLHGATRRRAFSCIACFIRFISFSPRYAL
jgi:hypothetical protein